MITEHAICALPADNPHWRYLVIRVQRRGSEDSWVLEHQGYYLVLGGEWSPSAADALRLEETLALELAAQWAPLVEANGLRAADLEGDR